MPLLPTLTNKTPTAGLYAPAGSGGGGGGSAGPDLVASTLTLNASNYIAWPPGSNLNLFPGGSAYGPAFYFSPGNPAQGGLGPTNALYIPSVSTNTQVYFGADNNTCFMSGDTANGDQIAAIALLGSTVSISSLIVSSLNAAAPAFGADPTFNSCVVNGQTATSSVVTNFALASTIFTGSIAGVGLNVQVENISTIEANNASLSTLNTQDLATTGTASIPVQTTSTLTIHETTENPGATYDGGIHFDIYGALPHLSIPDYSTIGIKSQANWDANGVSTNTLNAVQLGDFGAPFGQYDQLADFAVGRLLVGGPSNGVGLDFQYSGPKPFISASNAIWTATNPPSSDPVLYPALYTSPIITSNVITANLTSLQNASGVQDTTLSITGINGSYGNTSNACAALNSLSWFANPPNPSTFYSTSILVGSGDGADIDIIGSVDGSVNITCPIIEIVGSYPSTAIIQGKDLYTQIYNTGGVKIGTTSNINTNEIKISPGVIELSGNLIVSSINGQIPAAGAFQISQSTLFSSSPFPGFAEVSVVAGALPVILGTTFDLSGGYSYTLGGVFQHTPSPNATNSWDAGAQLLVDADSGGGFRPPTILNSTLFGRDQGFSFTWYQPTDGVGALEVTYTDPVGSAASTTAQAVYTSLLRFKS